MPFIPARACSPRSTVVTVWSNGAPVTCTPVSWRLPMRPASRMIVAALFLLLFAVPRLPAQAPIPADVLTEVPGTVLLSGGGKAGEAARGRFVELAGGDKAD